MQNLGFTPDQFETTPFRLSTGDAYAVPARCCGRKAEKGAESVIGLIRLLVRRFPVMQRLLGEESFMRAACPYVLTHPLQRGGLLYFGETFPTFLRSLGGAASIEYLADIASLEWARHKASYALPAVPVGSVPSSWLSSAQLPRLRVALHPSVSLILSRFPIVTIWDANRSTSQPCAICLWKAEPALVAKPCRTTEMRRLPPGGYEFFNALGAGLTIGDAAAAATQAAPEFETASNLTLLAESKIAMELR
jgi:hypothetical protein